MADRPAPVEEIEITPEMIEAGAEALFGCDWTNGFAKEFAVDVYRVMAALDPSRP